MAKTFSIYRSSAGSGKTRTLAREYLKLALQYKSDYFRYILAVTFTNKASQEMKDRILDYLNKFARGESDDLSEELKALLGCDEQTFQAHSQAVQSFILHHYADFSISTIDAFFQKVIRSFTRESGLIGDYRLEVDHDTILEEVIDNLIDELGNNKELTEWVVEFAKENLENERPWDVRFNLREFAREIFREEFKEIEDELLDKTKDASFFKNLMQELKKRKFTFINFIKGKARDAIQIIHDNNLTSNDFKYAGGGAYSFFIKISKIGIVKDFDEKEKGKRPEGDYQKAINWPNKDTRHTKLILELAEKKLIPLLNEILVFWKSNFENSYSAEVALSNFYSFGLIADIARKLKEYKDENNIMLLADAPKFLNGVIQDSDTPFIYEKVGSFYRNYLIDEFQDTSGMQWKNFRPLIMNSLDQGFPGLVVGDVKQAIYRWRGGDLNLLQQEVVTHIGKDRVEVKGLDKNFRSSFQIVSFNNALFQTASKILSSETDASISELAYSDVRQEISKKEEGFVRVSFVNDLKVNKDTGEEGDGSIGWMEASLEKLAQTMEDLQLQGAALSDIAILVRKNEEGQRVATHLLNYKNSGKAKAGCKYDVVSNESLRIDGAATVNLLLGAMRYLLNAEDAIARAQLAYEFARLHEPQRDLALVFSVANQNIFENNLPASFTEKKALLKKLPLMELTETLIEIFALGRQQGELVYLQAFQNLVLEFYTRERNDLAAFLDWWEDNAAKNSVQISGEVNAAQILTIHKSKGLQFKYVIIPFCSWNLDHEAWKAPNLWVKSDRGSFADAGYLPVRYAKHLEQTFFADYYTEEHARSYLDNLNLVYVAFTRASYGLIVTAPHPEVTGTKNTVAGLLHRSIDSTETFKDKWNSVEGVLQFGDWRMKAESKETDNTLTLAGYLSSSWRDKLVVRQSGKTFFDEGVSDSRQKINYGIQMHAVLSRLKYSDEIEKMLDLTIFEGLITEDVRPMILQQLKSLLEIPEIGTWFSHDWKVRTEVPVLLPGGEESRLDRLIHQDKRAIVIDFKTGARKKDDNRQVLQYIEILRQMNFTEVSGYLLYLKEKEVVEVKAGGKQKMVREKKNKDQLSLGFGVG